VRRVSMPNSITPPDEQLVRKWIEDWAGGQMKGPVTDDQLIVAAQAAQWGADQELEACCEWTAIVGGADALRAARRPQPPSLKEQALRELGDAYDTGQIDDTTYDAIRRALEALPND
jgi:hypothetical protein